ncbi:solute carrier family 2, facilitated glucose transporter member 5-like [Tiliqua scincoides]|uniref:solute carrier family 2, facilitated glucose transporter member 5-like n=1 Tax=Tiliqua scincoides TaxID=71010 RepID=UPI0034627967
MATSTVLWAQLTAILQQQKASLQLKGVLLVNDIFSIASTIILAVSQSLNVQVVYALARFITGICTGIFSCAVPIYLGEISPTNRRGGICILPMMFISVGMLLSQVLGSPDVLGTEKELPFLLSVPGILALFQLFLLLPFPESPRYLLIQKKDEEGARQALQKLRDQYDVEDEIEELHQEERYEMGEKQMTVLKLLRSPHLRWQLVCVVILFTTQQFSGVNAAYYYADRVFLAMKIDENNVRYSSALLTFLGLFVHGFSAEVALLSAFSASPCILNGPRPPLWESSWMLVNLRPDTLSVWGLTLT